MVATSELPGLKDDLHIVDKLREKENEVYKSLGDAASVFKLYDAAKEEELVAQSIAGQDEKLLDGTPSEQRAAADAAAWDLLFNDSTPSLKAEKIHDIPPSLFDSDRHYYEALILQLKSDRRLNSTDAYFDEELLEVKNTPELDRILYDLPREAKPAPGGMYQLTLNKELVQRAIDEARKRRGEWARFQLLYELHPVIRYLMTRLEASVDKDVAMVARLERLPAGTAHYLLQGISANSLGQSILSDFFMISMHMDGTLATQPVAFDEFLQQYRLNEELHTLHIDQDDLSQLQEMLPAVIKFGHQLYMDQKQQQLQVEMEQKMLQYKENMDAWRATREHQLQLEFGQQPYYGFIKKRRADREYEIQTILDSSSRYFQDLTSLKGDPCLRLIAVFYNK